MKTAIVIGATGLVGNHLIEKLLDDERYSRIKIFVRRSTGINNKKLEEQIVDFDDLNSWKEKLSGDELYSAMGTTIKKAGSKEVQYKIDFTYQYETAKAAAENGVGKYFLVSSAGANHQSNNFYLKIKGELENKISELPFKKIVILQPSLLLGERNEKRIGEKIAAAILPSIGILPLIKKYKPIEAETVAQALINSANDSSEEKFVRYILDQIFEVGRK